jgi:S1-C subfamily serine protease
LAFDLIGRSTPFRTGNRAKQGCQGLCPSIPGKRCHSITAGSDFRLGDTEDRKISHSSLRKSRRFQVTTKDGRRFAAKFVGRDPGTDLAVLRLQEAQALKSIPMGDSDSVEVGDFVIAIGNPFGWDRP